MGEAKGFSVRPASAAKLTTAAVDCNCAAVAPLLFSSPRKSMACDSSISWKLSLRLVRKPVNLFQLAP